MVQNLDTSENRSYSTYIFFFCGAPAQRGLWLPHSWGFQITYDIPHSVGLLCTSDQLTLTTDSHPSPPAGFEPAILEGERPHTYAWDGAASGTDWSWTGVPSRFLNVVL